MVRAQPDSILELGGGRSTTFLADYAARYRKRCVSIEQSDVWYRKILADLAFMRVEGTHVHHVPLVRYPGDVSWYDLDEVRRLVDGRAFDMVFLDGPQGGARRSVFGQEVVRHAAREARLIVVDDVHRDYNMAVFDELAGRTPRNGRFFLRYGGNLLAMATTEWRPIVRSTLVMTGFPILHEPPAIAKPGASHDD